MQNMDPNITNIFADALLYILVQENDLPKCPNVDLHSDILCIRSPSIILCYITKPLTPAQQTYFTHVGSKRMGLKWSIKLITKIWKLIYGQWLHQSKLKQAGEELEENTTEIILHAKITDGHGQV